MLEVICGFFGGGCIYDNDKGLLISFFLSFFVFFCEIRRVLNKF